MSKEIKVTGCADIYYYGWCPCACKGLGIPPDNKENIEKYGSDWCPLKEGSVNVSYE